MSNENSDKKKTTKTKRRPIKTQRPKKEVPRPVSAAAKMVRETDFRTVGLYDASGRMFDQQAEAKFEQSRGFPKLTGEQIMAILEQRDAMADASGEDQIELGLLGYVTQDAVDTLERADIEGEAAAFIGGDTCVQLWHAGNPPTRALIPVFVMPEGFSVVEDESDKDGQENKPFYAGYHDPDDIQGGALDQQPVTRSFSEQIEEYEQKINKLNVELANSLDQNRKLKKDYDRLVMAKEAPTLSQRLGHFFEDHIKQTPHIDFAGARARPTFYVVNTSPSQGISGELILTYKNGNDQDQMFKLPQTWLPIEPTYEQRLHLLMAPSFTSALEQGLIKLVSKARAQRILKLDMARGEQERLDKIAADLHSAARPRTIADSNVEITNAYEQPE